MAIQKPLPPAELLWELFEYQVFTGRFIRRTQGGRQTPGDLVGNFDGKYWYTKVNNARYSLHRLIVKWFTGQEPGPIVEHIDDDGSDNRIWRLIDSDHRANKTTSTLRTSVLPTGVIKVWQRYRVAISIKGCHYRLGTYDTPEEASDVYQDAVQQIANNPDWTPS